MENKHQLIEDLREIIKDNANSAWSLTDLFALGYLAGKYGLDKLKDNEEAVVAACKQYDETDELQLADTISAPLVEHGIITEIKTDDETRISETTQS